MEEMNEANTTTEPIIKREDNEEVIKTEREIRECVACASLGDDHYDIFCTHTSCASTTLHDFLCRYTEANLATHRHICRTCSQLIDTLERAEIEYNRLKTAFEDIIAKNPLFETSNTSSGDGNLVKTEKADVGNIDDDNWDYDPNLDSDYEPLLVTKKKKRKINKRKKKSSSANDKTKPKSKDGKTEKSTPQQWECGVCGEQSTSEKEAAEHSSQHHSNRILCKDEPQIPNGSHSPLYANGSEENSIAALKLEEPEEEEPNSTAETALLAARRRRGGRGGRAMLPKTVYSCDQCDAKYTSLARFRYHKEKHEVSKPPYICEICGAHYKHKKACDIHVAMHKGISDWKCEECDKLFPSKGALQRHNNIHTGKLNYQCDLCGKSFIHTSSFKMHKLSHTGMKPHACDVCGLALMTRSHLKRHKRVHSGEKRHECTLCGKRFSERYNLVAHAKSHDVGNQSANTEGDNTPAPPRRRLFRCFFCEERFERRYMLERHMEVTHQRSLEKQPPKPRNTMTKLLKAQAAASKAAAEALQTRDTETSEKSPAASEGGDVGGGGGAGDGGGGRPAVKEEARPLVLVLTAGGPEKAQSDEHNTPTSSLALVNTRPISLKGSVFDGPTTFLVLKQENIYVQMKLVAQCSGRAGAAVLRAARLRTTRSVCRTFRTDLLPAPPPALRTHWPKSL
ncbi:Zinc finger protein 681 [Eumeta japonica]|uniref:Zinc finger protein 681 n=1 Tax=Eumeta variegata TaxID=151549 RepID=A0A4C1X403_EUMVA|nr:Zinc finger protein 681 [Eumeta japonica]